MIQANGVNAIVYTAKLGEDKAALLAIMREATLSEEEAMSHKAQEDGACASCLRKDETISELREAMSHKDAEISRLESRLQCRTEELEEARKKHRKIEAIIVEKPVKGNGL